MKIKVDDNFIEIYRNFNIYDVSEGIKLLEEVDKYLLLFLCLDKHSDEDTVSVNNFHKFKDECLNILDFLENGKTENIFLKELVSLTKNNYIDTDNIVDKFGNPMPDKYTVSHVRDIKISKIINKK